MKYSITLLLASLAPLALAQAVLAPDTLMKNVTEEVIAVIRQDKDVRAGDPRKIAELVETRVLPHFSFPRMTQIAVAVNWRRATPQQQQRLVEEFRSLLVRTYSNSLTLYRDQEIVYRPLHMRPGDTDVTVKSEIKQRGAQPVSLNYDLEKTPNGWKVYDVKIGGVSLIATYREEFAAQVRESGIDGLIKALESKNRDSRQEKR